MNKNNSNDRRIRREIKTIQVMIKIFCHNQHRSGEEICPDCLDILEYAKIRIGKCPFKENKPTCANCTVHCFKSPFREKVKRVMAYAGPRMTLSHPILTFFHVMDKFRQVSARQKKN